MSLGSPDNTKYKSKREKRLMTINDALETVVNNAVVKHHVSMCSIFSVLIQCTWPRYEQHLFLLLS